MERSDCKVPYGFAISGWVSVKSVTVGVEPGKGSQADDGFAGGTNSVRKATDS